jgi:hypothetical protein
VDVAHHFKEERIAINEYSLVPSLKEMATAVVAPVDPAGIPKG